MIIHEFFRDTVNGRNPAPVEVGSLSHYLMTGFIHSRWLLGISSINRMFIVSQHILPHVL